MNDVDDLWHRILDRPTPPMRDGQQVLAIARRDAKRRVRIAATAGGLVATAMLAVAATAWSLDTASVSPRPAASRTDAADPRPPRVPPRQEAGQNGARIAEFLADALPAGYTSRPAFGSNGTRMVYPSPQSNLYTMWTELVVSSAGAEGRLSGIVVNDDIATPAGDLCAPAVAARLDNAHLDAGDATCEVITIGGVAVRTTSAAGASTATRFLAGGFITISLSSDLRSPAAPMGSPFTVEQLAGLAAGLRLSG